MFSPNKESKKLSQFSFGEKKEEASPLQQLNSPLSLNELSPTDEDQFGIGRSLDAPSESSLIFERNVQDPLITSQPVSHCPRCLKPKSQCHHNSILNLPQHINSENFIPPVLDSTASILNSSKNLDDVDMVYSPRRPSTINLANALGERPSLSKRSSAIQQSPSSTNLSRDSEGSKSTLSFYSYADMINNEDSELNYQRRPSISQTLSQSFLGTSANPRLSRTNSSVSRLRSMPQVPTINTSASPHQTSASPSLNRPQPRTYNFKKFALDSPSESDDEEKPAKFGSFSSSNSKNKRQSMSSSISKLESLDNVVDDNDDDSASFVTRNVGDTLRRYTGELKG